MDKRIRKMCYGRIERHLDELNAENDSGRILQLMNPKPFLEFAYEAWKDISVFAADSIEADAEEMMNHLYPCLGEFDEALKEYAGNYAFFVEVYQETHRGIRENGARVGAAAVSVLGSILGPLPALLTAGGLGFLVGKRAENQIAGEEQRLHLGFKEMLESYDEAIKSLVTTAAAAVKQYCE